MGKYEAAIIAQSKRRGKLPDRIANAPILLPGLDFFYNAFQELSTCRYLGMGIGPIPWNCIIMYSDRWELDTRTEYDLFYFIRALDEKFIDFSLKQIERKEKIKHRKPPKK